MCRWLAYSGSPILLEELLYKPAHSLIDQSMHARLGATTTNGDGFGAGWDGAGGAPGIYRALRPALAPPQPPGPRRPRLLAAVSCPHPRLDRHGCPADQLPPVPPRALAVGPQRPHPGFPSGQARAVAGGGPVAVPGDRGVGRLRGHVLPGIDLRPRARPAHGGRSDGRLLRGGG